MEAVQGVPAAKLAADLLGAAQGLADPVPVIRAALALLEAAPAALRVVEGDGRRAAGA